jgi:hypothetical protein
VNAEPEVGGRRRVILINALRRNETT